MLCSQLERNERKNTEKQKNIDSMDMSNPLESCCTRDWNRNIISSMIHSSIHCHHQCHLKIAGTTAGEIGEFSLQDLLWGKTESKMKKIIGLGKLYIQHIIPFAWWKFQTYLGDENTKFKIWEFYFLTRIPITTPWKINGWKLQITHLERKMIWTKPPGNYVPAVNLPGCR